MKAYGNTRRDMLTCKYGCCTGKYHKTKANLATKRGRKKRARRFTISQE